MPAVSIVVNVDSRKQRDSMNGMFNGVVNNDFLTDGIYNKVKFFDGFDKELIVFVDKHENITEQTLQYLNRICDTLVIRKHTDEPKFNDYNYLAALSQARGDIIAHFDQDCAAFTSGADAVNEMIKMLDDYDYVCYPTYYSPHCVHDQSFDYKWASTRFFMCKRSTLDFTELKKCLEDYEYCYNTYPASRKCHWLEHCLGLMAKYKGKGVFYPKIDLNKLAIFCWANYEKYTL